MLPEDKITNPYFDIVVQLDDGPIAMISGYLSTISDSMMLETAERAISNNLPSVLGKTVYAVGSSVLYKPESTFEEMSGEAGWASQHLQQISDIPLLEPLTITAAKYLDSVGGVVLKLKLPDGRDALSLTAHASLTTFSEASFLNKVVGVGGFITAIPHDLSPREIQAIRHGTLFRGMSKRAVEYSQLGRLSETENDWGSGGTQLKFGDSTYIYLNEDNKVVDWQMLDGN